MIPSGSLVHVTITGKAGSLWTSLTPADVQQRIVGALTDAGFNVRDAPIVAADALPSVFSFSWAGSLQLRTGQDFLTETDVDYQISQAIQAATGYPCTLNDTAAGDAKPAPPADSPFKLNLTTVVIALGALVVVGVLLDRKL